MVVYSPELSQLIHQYREKFPGHTTRTLDKTLANSITRELQKYFGGNEGETFVALRHFQDAAGIEYLKHLLKYQDKLDAKAISVYADHKTKTTEKLYAEYDKPRPFKTFICNLLSTRIRPGLSGRPATKFNSIREELHEGTSELQFILRPELNLTLSPGFQEDGVGGDDPWHPIHLSLGLHHFQRTVNSFISFPPKNKKVIVMDPRLIYDHVRHQPTYKKKYLQHMNDVVESNHEFLLAIISAYGTEASKYPSTLLDLMQKRNMIKDFEAESKERSGQGKNLPKVNYTKQVDDGDNGSKSEPAPVTFCHKGEDSTGASCLHTSPEESHGKAQPQNLEEAEEIDDDFLDLQIQNLSFMDINDDEETGNPHNYKFLWTPPGSESDDEDEGSKSSIVSSSGKGQPAESSSSSSGGQASGQGLVAALLQAMKSPKKLEMAVRNLRDDQDVATTFSDDKPANVEKVGKSEHSGSGCPFPKSIPESELNMSKPDEATTDLGWRLSQAKDDETLKIMSTAFSDSMKARKATRADIMRVLKESILKDLPRLVVRVPNVLEKYAGFLGILFKDEIDLNWFVVLCHEFYQEYLPVWVQLLQEVGKSIQGSEGESGLLTKLKNSDPLLLRYIP